VSLTAAHSLSLSSVVGPRTLTVSNRRATGSQNPAQMSSLCEAIAVVNGTVMQSLVLQKHDVHMCMLSCSMLLHLHMFPSLSATICCATTLGLDATRFPATYGRHLWVTTVLAEDDRSVPW
jgi:hypothetical protein